MSPDCLEDEEFLGNSLKTIQQCKNRCKVNSIRQLFNFKKGNFCHYSIIVFFYCPPLRDRMDGCLFVSHSYTGSLLALLLLLLYSIPAPCRPFISASIRFLDTVQFIFRMYHDSDDEVNEGCYLLENIPHSYSTLSLHCSCLYVFVFSNIQQFYYYFYSLATSIQDI